MSEVLDDLEHYLQQCRAYLAADELEHMAQLGPLADKVEAGVRALTAQTWQIEQARINALMQDLAVFAGELQEKQNELRDQLQWLNRLGAANQAYGTRNGEG